MKHSLLLLLALFLFACNDSPQAKSETANTDTKSTLISEQKVLEMESSKYNYQVALDFLDAYIEQVNSMDEPYGIVQWMIASPFVTEYFHLEFEAVMIHGWRTDPIMGLGFDPIFDAQDYPNDGFRVADHDLETGYITVKGIDWEEFTITMKVANVNGKTLVDGCGIINIPENKRAAR